MQHEKPKPGVAKPGAARRTPYKAGSGPSGKGTPKKAHGK